MHSAASIVLGFFIVGTPGQARQYRLDEQRTQDLQNIQWQIVSYWQQKQKLPAALPELRDSISGWVVPQDPTTGEPYIYRATGTTAFELCATFASESNQQSNVAKPIPADFGGISDNWQHKAGDVCFIRTIDPERYPPFNK